MVLSLLAIFCNVFDDTQSLVEGMDVGGRCNCTQVRPKYTFGNVNSVISLGVEMGAAPGSEKVVWFLASSIGVVLLCDPRHGLTELDDILLDVLRPRVEEGLKFLVLLTKADKLNKTEATKALSIAKLQSSGGVVRLFSALKKQGVAEASQIIWDWVHAKDSTVLSTAPTEQSETSHLGSAGHEDNEDESLN